MARSTVLIGVASVWLISLTTVPPAVADTFGSGENAFDIEFVTIGDPGNPPDTTLLPNPAGSVAYPYRIGKYEISEQMIDKANAVGDLGVTHDERGPDKPVTSVTWFEAAEFVNWLNRDSGSSPAYKFDDLGEFQIWEPGDPGYDPLNPQRNSAARYFLPTNDEWYKAAHFDPASASYFDYATGSDVLPIPVASGTAAGTAVYRQGAVGPADIMQAGALSPYRTMAQSGNVTEWLETPSSARPNHFRLQRGGSWDALGFSLSSSAGVSGNAAFPNTNRGFRVASIIPEPASGAMLGTALLSLLAIRQASRRLSTRSTFK